MSEISKISEKVLKSALKKSVRKAIRENKALGISTTALINGNIVEISPDNTLIVIHKLNLKRSKRLTKKHFTLG